jgi:hypothetical protein
MLVGHYVWGRQVGLVRGSRWLAGSSARAARWQEQQDEVIYGSLVEPQSKDRAGTMWGQVMSGEWCEATLSPQGF